ncbi:hypothetical protein THAOC_31665, partial [Thalassiosira oceanica]
MNFPLNAIRFLAIVATTAVASAALQPDDRSELTPERQPAAAQQAVEMTGQKVQVQRGGKPGVLQFDEQDQQHGRMAKAKKPKSG